MTHVLLGFAEALPAPEVVFSLRDAGHRVSAFARGKDLPLRHLPLENFHVLPDPASGAEAAVAGLRALLPTGGAGPDFVLPLDDEGLWLTHAAFGDDPRALCASTSHVNVALDKTVQIEAARKAGLAVPPTRVIRGAADLAAVDWPHLPAILKPALAVQVEGEGASARLAKGPAHYLIAPADLTALASWWPETGHPYLLQPLISGTGEGVFGFATADGVAAWSGHRRLRMMNPHGSGSSACRSLVPEAGLKERVARFLAEAGWRGPFMAEVLRDAEGTPWFMEMNGRMWGSLALARRQGLEYPAWTVAAGLDPGFRPPNRSLLGESITVRHLGRDLLHLLFTLRGPKTEFHRVDWPRLMHSLVGVLRPGPRRLRYNYDPAYPLYVWRDAAWTLRKVLR